MFKRWKVIIKNWFNSLTSSAESPKIAIEGAIQGIVQRIEEVNHNIAKSKASCIILQDEIATLEQQEKLLDEKIKLSIKSNKEELALSYVTQLKTVTSLLNTLRKDFEDAVLSYNKALTLKQVYLRMRDERLGQANQAIKEYESSKVVKSIAKSFGAISIDGDGYVFDAMLKKLKKQTAYNKAISETAFPENEIKFYELEEEVRVEEAKKTLNEYKNNLKQ
jgi:phage shock protein A